ncbi:hypothetical protein NUU61_005686 [Penicillium alfredii]|uniref:Uncharacterized protein n=1 Tax=Penicillium alfredii TaxID=1506179 RepID=A0A9W9K827_9EURO|nr:uncharacterized protein NUU61_005686 [Penicillium alfredii]KAJ5096330.1 hypothetical protein NUU61_005686 [Penicillium alfredii]
MAEHKHNSFLGSKYLPFNTKFLPPHQQQSITMCFGSKDKDSDPYWWGYIDDGQGWTARRKSEYMKTPEYNPELRRQLR